MRNGEMPFRIFLCLRPRSDGAPSRTRTCNRRIRSHPTRGFAFPQVETREYGKSPASCPSPSVTWRRGAALSGAERAEMRNAADYEKSAISSASMSAARHFALIVTRW